MINIWRDKAIRVQTNFARQNFENRENWTLILFYWWNAHILLIHGKTRGLTSDITCETFVWTQVALSRQIFIISKRDFLISKDHGNAFKNPENWTLIIFYRWNAHILLIHGKSRVLTSDMTCGKFVQKRVTTSWQLLISFKRHFLINKGR